MGGLLNCVARIDVPDFTSNAHSNSHRFRSRKGGRGSSTSSNRRARRIDYRKLYESLKQIPKRCQSPYTNFYAEGASRMGWKIEVMSRSKSVVLLHPPAAAATTSGGVSKDPSEKCAPVLIRRHKIDVLCNRFVAKIFSSKFETHRKCLEYDWPAPETIFLESNDIPIRMRMEKGPFVVKPVEGSQGKGVHMGVTNKKQLLNALNNIGAKRKVPCLVQEEVSGNDYRVLILRGSILDIVERIPAFVVGNGVDTTNELVKLENKRRKACELPLLVKVATMGPFTDVPLSGVRRQVQDKANVSLGGIPLRVPIETVHSKNIQLFNEIAKTFPEQPMIGIDFLGDMTVPWSRSGRKPSGVRAKYSGVILELNSTPQMFCHTLRGSCFNLNIVQTILGEAATAARVARAKRKSKRRSGSGSGSGMLATRAGSGKR